MPNAYFTPATLKFLQELEQNNRRDWFEDNRARYEEQVRGPALAFIGDMAPELAAFAKSISPASKGLTARRISMPAAPGIRLSRASRCERRSWRMPRAPRPPSRRLPGRLPPRTPGAAGNPPDGKSRPRMRADGPGAPLAGTGVRR